MKEISNQWLDHRDIAYITLKVMHITCTRTFTPLKHWSEGGGIYQMYITQ